MHDAEIETFLSQWWAYHSPPLSQQVEDWIEKSYLNPKAFMDRIFAFQQEVLPLSKSEFGKLYDFYQDCILRHLKSSNLAISFVNTRDQSNDWTYEDLHRSVNYHVKKWSTHSPEPGQLIAIILQPGIHFLIALLTALRFGLKICYLPPHTPFLGNQKISSLLAEIRPQFIVAEERIFTIEGIPLLPIDEQGQDEINHQPTSYAYEANSDIFLTISLYRDEAQVLVPVKTETLYLNTLRDALFTLNLKQYPNWSTPLSCPIRTEPCSTITSLISGSMRIQVPDDVIQADPQILEDKRINILGISAPLQELWSKTASIPTRHLKCCYKNSTDVNQPGWKAFVQLNELNKIPVFHLLIDNSVGGIVFFSRPCSSLDPLNIFVKPTLGTSWQLANFNGTGEKSMTGFGIFNILLDCPENDAKKGNFTLAQVGRNYIISGSIEPCREAITYPIDEIEDCVNELPFVEGCMVYSTPKAGAALNHHFVLLVFVSPLKRETLEEEKKHWNTDIELQIINHVGKAFVPDQIEYYPFLPKMHRVKLFGIDRDWCGSQFSSGLFSKKKTIPMYNVLNVLKKLVVDYSENAT